MNPFELWRELWKNPWQKRFLIPLLVINFFGSIYGYYWYGGQLSETPPAVWPLVPDSPLSTTLFALMAGLFLLGLRSGAIGALACATCIKYGLWAVVLITDYWLSGGEIALTEVFLWLSHLGMALEGWIYLRTLRVAPVQGAGVLAWMILNDLADYRYQLHPYFYMSGQFALALSTAVIMTALTGLRLLFSARLKR